MCVSAEAAAVAAVVECEAAAAADTAHRVQSTMGPAYKTQGCPLRVHAPYGYRSWGRMPSVVD
jgi:hypothetical protein